MHAPDADPGPDPFADGLPTLDGAAARLRAVGPADDADLLAVFADEAHLRYWSHGPLADLAEATVYRERIEAGVRDGTAFRWAITAPPDDRLLGTVTLWKWDRDNRHAEVGFILRPDAAGRGLATDAVRTAIRFGRDAMALWRVEADIDPENAASAKLLERLGFVREGYFRERWFTFLGEWKDAAMYGLLTRDLEGP